LNSSDGTSPGDPDAPQGIYYFGLRLKLPGSGLADSDPIYFVYNNGLDEQVHEQAIDWIQTNIVPEPSTWLLAACGASAVVIAGRRKGTGAMRRARR
jgi:hypothetical protein